MRIQRMPKGSGRSGGHGSAATSLALLLLLIAIVERQRTASAAGFLSRPPGVFDRGGKTCNFLSSPTSRTTWAASTGVVSSRGGIILASSASSSSAPTSTSAEGGAEGSASAPPSAAASSDVATDTDAPPPTSSARRRPAPSGPPDFAAYSRGYFTPREEIPCLTVDDASSGSLPADLVGTYYRAGPAMFTAGNLPPPASSLVQPDQPPVSHDGEDPSRMVLHPFEGDGAVFAMTFHGGGNVTTSDDDEPQQQPAATARFRYVRTAGFERERRRGARVYTGMDPTRSLGAGAGRGNDIFLPMFRHHLQPGLNRKRKNTSNTRALYWGKKLLTTWEGGLPYKLDALALSTEGRSQLGGALKPDDPLGQRGAVDSDRNRLVLYSCRPEGKKSTVTLMEFDERFRLLGEGGYEHSVPGYMLTSDFAVTANYAVFVQPPVNVNGLEFLMKKDPGTSLSLDENGQATLHLIPRQGSGKVQTSVDIPLDEYGPEADVQFVNAYEEGDEVVVDLIRPHRRRGRSSSSSKSDGVAWPWCSTAEEYADRASPRYTWRYRVRVPGAGGGGGGGGGEGGRVTKERLGGGIGIQAYFGTINPEYSGRRHRYAYAAVGGRGDGDGDGKGDVATPPQGIARVDCDEGTSETWFPEPFEFCGEPTYAPRSRSDNDVSAAAAAEEDDGYVISLLFNGKTGQSEVIVLDARDVGRGPVARVPLGGAGIPHGYFGCFVAGEGAKWSADEIDRRVRLADKMEAKGNRWNEVKSDFSGLGLRLDDFEEYFGVDLF